MSGRWGQACEAVATDLAPDWNVTDEALEHTGSGVASYAGWAWMIEHG